jgi:hypothetical protein
MSPQKSEHGDFQTPLELTRQIVQLCQCWIQTPEIILEPTCGTGNFIQACLERYQTIEYIIGYDIQPHHVFNTTELIQTYFENHPKKPQPKIFLQAANLFTLDPTNLIPDKLKSKPMLVIGNPPWVTASEQGLKSWKNLPPKSNFNQQRGWDAITGKSNFDIAEAILLYLFDALANYPATFCFIIKNSVIKRLVSWLAQTTWQIQFLGSYSIDTKRFFQVYTDASVFLCKTNATKSSNQCPVYLSLTSTQPTRYIGWVGNHFVADVHQYDSVSHLEGKSPLIWWQGIKHDCARVLELYPLHEDWYQNKLGSKIQLEHDLVFGLIKTRDLKQGGENTPTTCILLPQFSLSENPIHRLQSYPNASRYLYDYQTVFSKRKSRIYLKKPPFSIFGIGSYAFAPYKIGLSGFHKEPRISFIPPWREKPVMFDDTCYYLGFQHAYHARFVWMLMLHPNVQQFLQSLAFQEGKRPYTKEILMRLDLKALVTRVDSSTFDDWLQQVHKQGNTLFSDFTWKDWKQCREELFMV